MNYYRNKKRRLIKAVIQKDLYSNYNTFNYCKQYSIKGARKVARPQKNGLDYFPLNVDIFEDEKVTTLYGMTY